jgi:UDP-N-acetyl-2-amino-2-deoxyglucuronate dehydrogenase
MTGPAPRPLRFGLVGPGKVAQNHAVALREVTGAQLVAVCGRDPDRTRAFATAHGARPFVTLDEMLGRAELDALIVCTPHPQHAAPTMAACAAGVNVLVEKPMAVTVADCEAMLAAAGRARVQLGVISQRRWYEPVERVKAAIEEGRIGRPALGTVEVLGWRGPEYYAMDAWRGTWAGEGGGVLVNQAVHLLDLLLWLMGPLEWVGGQWANLNHPEIEVEDTAAATLSFRGGAVGTVTVSNSQRPGLWARIHVHGTSGASVGVQTDGGSSFVAGVTGQVEPPVNDIWTVPGEEARLAEWQAQDRRRAAGLDVMTHYHACQLGDFADAVRSGRPPAVTGEDGRRVVELIEAIYASGRRGGQPISIPEIVAGIDER